MTRVLFSILAGLGLLVAPAAGLESDRPTALASGDFDGDGVPDLVCGYAGADGGELVLYRGNVDAIYPNSPQARGRRAAGSFTDDPFHAASAAVAVPTVPDFVEAGDFDNDGHADLVTATLGNIHLELLRGDGTGGFAVTSAVPLPGTVTAMTAGEIDRADGLADLIVALDGDRGPAVAIFGTAQGLLEQEPELLDLQAPVVDLALGLVDEDPWFDLVVGAGERLTIVHGRDRDTPAERVLDRVHLPWTISSVAVGEDRRREIAVRTEDGDLRYLLRDAARQGRDARRWTYADESASRRALGVEHFAGQAVAVLPMRLNRDALVDLAILQEGGTEPVFVMSAAQAVITVNTASDDDTPGDGLCSLREAIENAEFNGDTTDGDCVAGAGIDAIEFAIGGGGAPASILPTRALPPMLDVVTIDGTTQGCLGPICIELDGSLAGNNRDGLVIQSGVSTVRGLAIHSFEGNGIVVNGPANLIEGNYIGTDLTGTLDRGNGQDGITIESGPSNTIGGTTVQGRNVISGNDDEGVSVLSTTCTGTRIQGNLIGTDVSGLLPLANVSDGVVIEDGPNSVVGGTLPGSRNVISGNGDDGVYVTTGESPGVRVQGNYLGTDITGSSELPNIDDGVEVRGSAGVAIGGLTAAARNVVSGNGGDGVAVTFGATETLVQGNFIGTDPNGTGAVGNGDDGVEIRDAADNTVGGLTIEARNIISGNEDEGISISSGASENRVQGNYIGTDVSGFAELGNQADGIVVSSSMNNVIGGLDPGSRNVVSGNLDDGIVVSGIGSTGNRIEGNFVGTDPNGTSALGNVDNGVEIRDGSGNTVGGTTVEARNVISGNLGDGVLLSGTATGNLVQGNFIGTDVSGTADLGNADDGVEFQGSVANLVGGTSASARNVISGNDGDGVSFLTGATGNHVQGNFIGTNPSGTAALPNADDGVHIQDSTGNVIGGTAEGAGNVISGNGDDGVHFFSPATTGNLIQGNLIGTDVSGTLGLGNVNDGVEIRESQNNTVGGTTASARNVISGNLADGVVLTAGATGNLIQGNNIGAGIDDAGLGNGLNGVYVLDASGNTIGGSSVGEGNLIQSSSGSGVLVTGASSSLILGNSIRLNAQLGIALVSGTVLPNDFGDPDSGPNDLQNYPVLSTAVGGPFGTTVEGNINSLGNTEFRLEFFASPFCDPSDHGEGASYLGGFDVTTGPIGNATFAHAVFGSAPDGQVVTATASNLALGVTSEFSACVSTGLHCIPELFLDKSGSDALLSWNDPPTPNAFDLIRGSLSGLQTSQGDYSTATDECIANNEPCCTFTSAGVPASGDGFWYLVRGDDCQGSTYDTGAPTQIGSRDGGVGGSGNDCP